MASPQLGGREWQHVSQVAPGEKQASQREKRVSCAFSTPDPAGLGGMYGVWDSYGMPLQGVRVPGTGQPPLPDQDTGWPLSGLPTHPGDWRGLGVPGHRPCCPCLPQCQVSSLVSQLSGQLPGVPQAAQMGPPANEQAQSPGTQPQEASFCPQSPQAPRSSEDQRVPQPSSLPEVGTEDVCWLFPGSPGPHWGPLSRLDLWPPLPGPVRQVRSPPGPEFPVWHTCLWGGGAWCAPPAHSCSRQA